MTELKNDKFDELIEPETFWLTFMHTEAKQSALDKTEFKFDNGLSVSVKQAKNPSDILWLNRGLHKRRACARVCCVVAVVFIVTFFA